MAAKSGDRSTIPGKLGQQKSHAAEISDPCKDQPGADESRE